MVAKSRCCHGNYAVTMVASVYCCHGNYVFYYITTGFYKGIKPGNLKFSIQYAMVTMVIHILHSVQYIVIMVTSL